MPRVLTSRNELPYDVLHTEYVDKVNTCNHVAKHLEDIANVIEYASMVDLENLKDTIELALRDLAIQLVD